MLPISQLFAWATPTQQTSQPAPSPCLLPFTRPGEPQAHFLSSSTSVLTHPQALSPAWKGNVRIWREPSPSVMAECRWYTWTVVGSNPCWPLTGCGSLDLSKASLSLRFPIWKMGRSLDSTRDFLFFRLYVFLLLFLQELEWVETKQWWGGMGRKRSASTSWGTYPEMAKA